MNETSQKILEVFQKMVFKTLLSKNVIILAEKVQGYKEGNSI